MAVPSTSLVPSDSRTRANHNYKYKNISTSTAHHKNSFLCCDVQYKYNTVRWPKLPKPPAPCSFTHHPFPIKTLLSKHHRLLYVTTHGSVRVHKSPKPSASYSITYHPARSTISVKGHFIPNLRWPFIVTVFISLYQIYVLTFLYSLPHLAIA